MRLPSAAAPLGNAVVATLTALALSGAPVALPLVALPPPAFAAARTVGEISGSGLVFKDTLKIEAFSDPKVDGVQLYLSDFQRPAVEKLVGDAGLHRPSPARPSTRPRLF